MNIIFAILQNRFFEITPLSLNGIYALVAYLATLCQVPVNEVGLIFSAIFSMLISLGFYSLGVVHIRHFIFGYLCAFIGTFFWLDSCDPIAWGDYPLLFAYYLITSAMAFSKRLFDSDRSLKEKFIYLTVTFIPLYGTYPIPVLYVLVWVTLLSIYDGFLVKKSCLCFLKYFTLLFFANLTSILLVMPYLYHPISHILGGVVSYGTTLPRTWGGMPVAKVNELLSLPFSVFYDPQNYTTRLVCWFTRRDKSFDLIPYGVISAFIIFSVGSWGENLQKEKWNIMVRASKILLVYYLLTVIFYLYVEYMDPYLYIIFPSERVMEAEGIFLTMMEALSIMLYWATFSLLFLRRKPGFQHNSKMLARVVAGFLFFVLIFSSLIGVCEPINANQTYVKEHLSKNVFLTKDDVILQSWIKENIPARDTILILPIDGGFNLHFLGMKVVGSYADHPILFGHNTPNIDFLLYTRLLTCLSCKPDDQETSDLIKRFNVKYIYLGARKNLKYYDSLLQSASKLGFPKFDFKNLDAKTLENSINYKLVKKVGNATIFRVITPSLQTIWKEEHFKENWSLSNIAGKNVSYDWHSDGNVVKITVGGGFTPNRVWYLKTLNINLTESDFMIIRVKGSSNAKFLVQGVSTQNVVFIGSSTWEKAPLNWTTYTYRAVSSGNIKFIVVGALTNDGNIATVYLDYIRIAQVRK